MTVRLSIVSIAVILVFFVLRFSDIERRIGFDWDQERDAFEVQRVLVEHRPVLIGPRVVNVNGFFLAPYYTYLLLPFYALSHLHPIGSLYFILFMNIVFVAVSFVIIKTIWNAKSAVLFLFLWGINPLLISYDITAWNVLPVPAAILCLIFILYKLQNNQSIKYWVLLGIALALGINLHFQFIFIILLTVFFLFFSRKQITCSKKNGAIAFLSFALMFLPLFIFDLRHEFLNTKLFLSYFLTNPDQLPRDMTSWILVLNNTLYPIMPIKNSILTIVLYISLFALTFWLMRKSKGFDRHVYRAFMGVLLITPVFFILYGKRPSEYYFVFLYPLLYIILIQSAQLLKKRSLVVIAGVILVVLQFQEYKNLLRPTNVGLYYKDKAVQHIQSSIANKSYNIHFRTATGRNTGFRYLLDYYGIPEQTDPDDPAIDISIPPESGATEVGGIGVRIPSD